MVISTRTLVKHIFENQHKFQKAIRHCSSNVLRIQELEDLQSHQNQNQPSQNQKQPNQETSIEDIRKSVHNITQVPYLNKDIISNNKNTQILTQRDSFKFDDLTVRLAAPYQLQPKPDVSDLVFGKYFSDHMLKVFYHKQLGGWQKPEIIPFENLVLHPAAKVLHYAIELFEGMKAYRGEDGVIRLFRPELNMERMILTARRTGLPPFDSEEMIKCLSRLISIDQEWVPHYPSSSLYIRPTFIGIDPTLGVASSESALLYAILCPVGSYFKSTDTGGFSLLADPSYTRAWPGGVGDRKMGSNYAPTIDIQSQASNKGLHQVLWLYGDDHQLTEAGTMNMFMVSIGDNGEKTLSSPPLNGLILPGVTRHSIIQLARHWDIKVNEAPITMNQVITLLNENRLLEMFGSGTACIVSPISRINYLGEDLHIPTLHQTKPLYKKIMDSLTAIQYGHFDHPWARSI